MKKRPKGFLSEKNIDHEGEIFDYITELHDYMWKFIRTVNPEAGGTLDFWIDTTLFDLESMLSSEDNEKL